jgi:fatty acid desaturase
VESQDKTEAWWRGFELPTWTVLISTYGAWLVLTWYAPQLPAWLLVVLGGYVLGLHGSLQHEALHGHPTRLRWLNTLLVSPPLAVWLPYTIYRSNHLAHHRAETLTHPGLDTESFYVSAATWRQLPSLARAVLSVNQTLVGRLLLGPWLTVIRFWSGELRRLLSGDRRHLGTWILQLAGVGVIYVWVDRVCGFPFWQYLLCFVWPGLSLTLMRSFSEHRPAEEPDHRTAIVEAGWLTRLLFLNNSYHVIHHQHPKLPWYELRDRYLQAKGRIRAQNGGFVFPGYLALARRYAWKMKDSPVYPGP